MTPKLKIIPLGGLGEIGKNMTVVEFGNDLIIIDCGMGFPDEDMYGIDVVLPDITYLRNNASRIRGMIITHGHEDHIGAVPYVLQELDVPIYTTPLTAALIELKLEEYDLLYNTQIFTKKAGSVFRVGAFTVEFIHVNHSIPDAVALAIRTPVGTIVHTGDFKIDVTPISGGMIDLVRLGELGNEGVLALLSDSTNVETPGHSDSERKVGVSFDKLFQGCDKRIIITTFASNVHRLQQIINVAAKYRRKVAVTGRSMENVLRTAMVLGYMDVPENVLVDLDQMKTLPKSSSVIISTGSQGEAMSALYRMAFSEHKQIHIDAGDRVIISASAIPGNENTISRVIDELVHGEYRMLVKHAELGKMMGVAPKNVIIAENGQVIEFTKKGILSESSVTAGAVLVDGSVGMGEVGSVVMHDRHRLAEDGMIVVVIPVSSYDRKLLADPEIITRGFIYVKESEDLMGELLGIVVKTMESCSEQNLIDWNTVKNKVKSNLSSYLYKTTQRSPMILPMITEI